jgi:hypothetical protein
VPPLSPRKRHRRNTLRARTFCPHRAATGPTGGGGSSARSPGPGDLGDRPAGPAHPQVPARPPGRLPRARGRRPADRDHLRATAQGVTWRGRRLKLRHRGTVKNHAWLKRRAAALNLRKLAGQGLTRRDGAWVLAT